LPHLLTAASENAISSDKLRANSLLWRGAATSLRRNVEI